jgi:hypothetical protein
MTMSRWKFWEVQSAGQAPKIVQGQTIREAIERLKVLDQLWELGIGFTVRSEERA